MSLLMRLKKKWDVYLFLLSFFCLLLLVMFGWGFYTAYSKRPLYYDIHTLFHAVSEKYRLQLAYFFYSEKYKKYPFNWYATHEKCSGVTIYEREKADKGYTFFAGCNASAFLIDMNGRVVHKWHLPFHAVWPDPDHVRPYLDPVPAEMIFWHKAHLFANGDVLAIYEGPFAPYGAGLVKIDAQSNLIWRAAINAHHDLAIHEDGRIFTLTHRYSTQSQRPRIDEFITILSPDGKVLENISLYKAIKTSSYAGLIDSYPYGDYLHTNNIDLLSDDEASSYPFLNAGDILLSHLGLEGSGITVVDGKTHQVKWVLKGLTSRVHDADFIGHGRIVYFDNDTIYSDGGSAIVEWDCQRRKPVWWFSARDYYFGFDKVYRPENDMFSSMAYGAQQRLPNGNYLITESVAGTLFEVTPAKEVVWKYVTENLDGKSVGIVNWGQRYQEEDLSFVDPVRAAFH